MRHGFVPQGSRVDPFTVQSWRRDEAAPTPGGLGAPGHGSGSDPCRLAGSTLGDGAGAAGRMIPVMTPDLGGAATR
jgi:hypothetical protein